MKFTAVYEPVAEGGYVAWLEEMPGVQTQGETLAEAKDNLLDAFNLSLKYLRDKARESTTSQSVREPFEVSTS
ncbi:MAG: putative RNase H-like HicB family nuclease [Limisphaerales bacterium]|jgi:predicted RNase H-like HicB family nuclease